MISEAHTPVAPTVDLRQTALDHLLSEPVEAAAARASARYLGVAGDPGRPVVLLGSGGLGRRTLAGLRALGVEVVAFTDNAPARWGTAVEGIPVLSPDEAARRHGATAVFVVSIWRAEGGFRTAALVDDLRARGCVRVARIGELYWAHPERFLPYYGIDLPSRALAERDAIRRAYAMLSDDASRREFVEQLRWRLHLDADGLRVELRRLTSVPGAGRATFFKLDIEGAEPGALEGAGPILQRNRPILAVSVYHAQGHPWQIALQLGELLPRGYRYYLRAYSQEGFDLVLYAVPEERAVA